MKQGRSLVLVVVALVIVMALVLMMMMQRQLAGLRPDRASKPRATAPEKPGALPPGAIR